MLWPVIKLTSKEKKTNLVIHPRRERIRAIGLNSSIGFYLDFLTDNTIEVIK